MDGFQKSLIGAGVGAGCLVLFFGGGIIIGFFAIVIAIFRAIF